MFRNIKKVLKRNNTIYFYASLIRYCRKKDFRDYIRKYGGADVLFVKHLGELHTESIVYNINNSHNAGFFCELCEVLQHLYYAERFHLTPVVNWTENKCYHEKMPINGTSNVFEYYYLPVSSIPVCDIPNCKNVVYSAPRQTRVMDIEGEIPSYYSKFKNVKELGRLYRKYIRLNPETRNYINTNISKVLEKKKTLGIHIRGTDFKQLLNDHPVYISPIDFVQSAKKLMSKYEYDQIFLATDSLEAIEIFKREFGKKLVFYEDSMRSNGETGVHYIEDGREHHHYLLGLEVLRDAYTLAVCDSLLCGISNVSLAAQYIKYAEYGEYQEVVLINHGLNHNWKDC